MKFISWNVNGLRACIQKGFLDEFNKLDADFFCLQETKLSEGQLKLDTPGYEQYWCYADKKGYSGTAIFTKHTPLSVSYGIGVPELDNEGRVITLEYQEFYLLTCYTPNAQRGLARIDHRMKWDDAFRAYLKKLDEVKPVILCGDLNVAHQEIDLKNPGSNRGNAGFSDEERTSFQKTLDLGFTDTFRYLYPDATGRYSWWSYMYHARENNAGWRIDYFLVSDRLQDTVHQADIYSHIMGSDHCPVLLDLDISVNGSIWSPHPNGGAKVISPPEKPKKEPKASAVSAKALVAFLLIFAIVMSCAAFLWKPISELIHSTLDDYVEFDVTVYYWPFAKATFDAFGGIGISSSSGSSASSGFLAITDEEATYYVPNADEDSLAASNIALRIVLPNEVGDPEYDWSVLLNAEAHFIEDLHVEQYYTDMENTVPDGWLIWGQLSAEADFDLTISSPCVTQPYRETVKLIPYLDSLTCSELSTEELAEYVANHDYLYDLIVEDKIFYYFSNCPALILLNYRDDAISALMNLQCDETAALQVYALLSTEAYREKMTPQEEADFLTLHYPSYPYATVSSDILYDYTNDTTEVLLSRVLYTSRVSFSMESCTSRESAGFIYDYYALNLQELQELEQREDAAALLLKYATTAYDKTAMHLLTVDVYADQLTEDQTIDFINSIYDNSIELFVCMLGENAPQRYADLMTTEQLIAYIASNHSLSEQILLYSTFPAMGDAEDYYQSLCEAYPALLELQSREDAVSALMNSSYAGDLETVNILLQTQAYQNKMTAREEADYITCQYFNAPEEFYYVDVFWDVDNLTTEQLVRYLGASDLDPFYRCSSRQAREYVYDFLLGYSQLLRELETRDDAVAALMNVTPRENSYITHYLLSLEVYQQKMTREENYAFLSRDYPSYPDTPIYG